MRNKRRLDEALVARELVRDIHEAQALIMAGRVLVNDQKQTKAGACVSDDATLHVIASRPYPSRGGEKLAGALDDLGLEIAGQVVVDVGAAAGGFTACLLERGARHVYPIDVARGALAWELRRDDRVTVCEGVNVRDVDISCWTPPPEGLVADVSFISLVKALASLLGPQSAICWALVLVKPQFEADPSEVEAGGVVRDKAVVTRTVLTVGDFLESHGLAVKGIVPSRLRGPAGNREFFISAIRGGEATAWRSILPQTIRDVWRKEK